MHVRIEHVEDSGTWAGRGRLPDGSIYVGSDLDGSLEGSKAKADEVLAEVFGADVVVEHVIARASAAA